MYSTAILKTNNLKKVIERELSKYRRDVLIFIQAQELSTKK